MSDFINIQQADITKEVTKIKIDVPFILLNKKCFVRVLCYDSNNEFVHKYEFELTGEDYLLWQSDEWLINYVCNKYNFNIDIIDDEN
jgi:hypothetical protein